MYRLRDLKNGQYQIHKNSGPAFEGDLASIFKKAVVMGIQPDEFEEAVIELEAKQHDYAEFGIFGCFLYSMADATKKAA